MAGSFETLKAVCVPLLSNSLLTPETIPRASGLLLRLNSILETMLQTDTAMGASTIEYVFFPVSAFLKRNNISSIPDVIMEKLMDVIAILFEEWWWFCEVDVWEQVLKLSAAIFVGIDGNPGPKGKRRDDYTMQATARCLWVILRPRGHPRFASTSSTRTALKAEERFSELQIRGQDPTLLPMLAQTLTSLLETSHSTHNGLQAISLKLILILIDQYLPEAFAPSILPGVTSNMVKIALGRQEGKGWSQGATVDQALVVLRTTIVAAIRDEICEVEGALRTVETLEGLSNSFTTDGPPPPTSDSLPKTPSFTPRSSVWLSATAAQLHIALNTLSSVLSHPNPVALLSLSRFSHALLSSTTQSLPDTQSLLLSFLLFLSTSKFPEVASLSDDHLHMLLLSPSPARFTLLQILSRSTRENLASLSRLLLSRSDAKVEHIARQITGVCKLSKSVHAVKDGVGKLLGPMGGIEQWGWNLLTVIEFTVPSFFVSTVQHPQALIDGGPDSANSYPFPEMDIKHVASQSTHVMLEDMFRMMGNAAAMESLHAVEWFVGVARRGRTAREASALWCAGRVLEGMADVSLGNPDVCNSNVPKRVEKVSRWIAQVMSEFWDQDEGDINPRVSSREDSPGDVVENDNPLPLEYVKGLNPLITRFDFTDKKPPQTSLEAHRLLHKVLSLQLLCLTSAILRTQFTRLLIHILYPVLHSLVSQIPYVSLTALAALHYISSTTAYASPSNLMLANFDYALDSVSRRLDRRQLDPEAAKVLVVLVRLVGKDIVSRAGDVVEACFDRLDEFHGYMILVEGLIDVLAEVVIAIEADHYQNGGNDTSAKNQESRMTSEDRMEAFLEWYQHRHEEPPEDYGPAPREDWANLTGRGKGRELDGSGDGNESENVIPNAQTSDSQDGPPATPTQVLTQQIVSHSIYFLTHPSPLIRARILSLLDTACPILSESALLSSIHSAWPYILTRMGDVEPFVVSAAASLIASLAEHVGEFMVSRIWNDVWPRFRVILSKLEQADTQGALTRRGFGTVGTESAHSQSHRLSKSILCTVRAGVQGTAIKSEILWDVMVTTRRFLHIGAHVELQSCARELFSALMVDNEDAVWLMLSASRGIPNLDMSSVAFLMQKKWDIEANARLILGKC
ncbi:hypothetical protein K439DRAFT_1420593 [Ramaria rubella]|nr:hypothetical protein K439DRAFT_1420593 [Ramaria rubella]